jgi:hypothetical protein
LHIITTYPLWYLIFCLLLGAGVSLLLYYRSKELNDFPKPLIAFLSVVRFIAVTLLAFFLLEPMLKLLQFEVEKPVIVIGIDNSTSMVMTSDSLNVRNITNEQLAILQNELSGEFEVRTYSFGERINEEPRFDYSDKETDISAFLNELHNRYSNRNLGAVVLMSDGLYNRGMNPIHQTHKVSAPVYTVATGDTTPQRDVLIREVVHNELAFLGNDFPVEVLIEASGFSGNSTAVTVTHKGAQLKQEQIQINHDNFQQALRFVLTAEETGIQKYTIAVAPLDGEFTRANNTRDIYIEVLDSKQKVLLMANSSHPDIRAIRMAIEANDNYALDVYLPADTFPVFENYHLVILHGIPSLRNSYDQALKGLQAKGIPVWAILTGQTDIQKFNDLNTGVRISNTRTTSNAASAAFNPSFSLFNIDAEQGNHFGKLPPLQVPFGEYRLTTQGQTVMNQRIGTVKTEFPLWTFCGHDDWKTGILSGEGIWRWRTMSYADFGSHEVFNTMVQKTVQYLASRENKEFLRVSGARSYRENEEIIFRAETYNRSYELYTDPEVQMIITDEDGRKFEFNFSRSGNAYRLVAGNLPAGNYSYTVISDDGNEQHKVNGAFSVVAVNIESAATAANHRLLYQMASTTGGEMLTAKEFMTLGEKLKASTEIASVVYERKSLADLINLRWIFFVLLALFAIEWFVRKRNGAY